MRFRTALKLAMGIIAATTGLTAQGASQPPSLNPREYDRLRHRLETNFNEQDLMIRNQQVDRSDVQHQNKEFETLKVFERIPFKSDIPGLQKDLNETANERGLKVQSFKLLPVSKKKIKPIPDSIFTDEPRFELSKDQVVEFIPFELTIEGEAPAIQAWMESWATDQMRLAEPLETSHSKAMEQKGPKTWKVWAQAFRFRDIKFPELKARDPMAVLPQWAVRNPGKFAQAQPLLWNIVTRTKQIMAQARPLYRNREELMLNDARMSFYIAHGISHTGKASKVSH